MLNCMFCFHCVYEGLCILVCSLIKHSGFYMYVHVYGASFSHVWGMVASSSPVGESRVLQYCVLGFILGFGLSFFHGLYDYQKAGNR